MGDAETITDATGLTLAGPCATGTMGGMTADALTAPTWFIDADSPEVEAFVVTALAGVDTGPRSDTATAVALFRAVRDGIRYDPYEVSRDPADYRASAIAGSASNWCVPG